MNPTPFKSAGSRWQKLLLVLAGLALAGRPLHAASEAEDIRIIGEMKQRLAVVQKQILASEDPAEQARLQKTLTGMMEEILPQLTPKTRAGMVISLKLVQPIQQAGVAYSQMIADYSASPQSDLTTIKSREDIQARQKMIDRFNAANQGLLDLLDGFGTSAEKMLDDAKVSAADKRAFLTGLSTGFGKQIGPIRAIRNLDTRLFAQLQAALNHLDKHWGKWKAKEGELIIWTDAALEKEFVAILDEINMLAERQTAAQQALSARL